MVIDSYGRSIGTDPGTTKEELTGVVNPTDTDKQEGAESAKIKYLGVVMIFRSDRGRYGKLVEELQNVFTKGNADYRKNTKDAYNLLVNYKTS